MREDDKTVLRNSYLLAGLTPAEQETAIAALHATAVVYPAGTIVSSPDTFTHALYFVVSGSLTVTREDGSASVLLRMLGAGASFGAASLFGCGETYPTTIRARTAVRILAITEGALETLFLHEPRAALAHIRFLGERVRFLNERLNATTGRNVESKVSKYLLDTYGKETFRSELNMTQVARSLDIGRASLYRLLTRFSADGAISLSRGTVRILDFDYLKRKANIS